MKQGINVLSLFDGMSCGQIALNKTGIDYENYFASEIDKHAIKVTQANYPKTIQLGSVVDLDVTKLPKIHLLIGGSPCQSFSFAGKRKGMSTKDEQQILTLEHYMQLRSEGYEFEGQSYLFWEYMRIKNEAKPDFFLLENVLMGEKWEKVLSKAIGANPIEINSSLLSAQNRTRLYWTNIGMKASGLFGFEESIIQQPKNKNVFLTDILEENVAEKYWLKEKSVKLLLKKVNIKNAPDVACIDVYNRKVKLDKKCSTLTLPQHCSIRLLKHGRIRKLTPIECERLQTVKDNYTNHVSDTQRYNMLGNGWTVDVIAHIFSYLDYKKKSNKPK